MLSFSAAVALGWACHWLSRYCINEWERARATAEAHVAAARARALAQRGDRGRSEGGPEGGAAALAAGGKEDEHPTGVPLADCMARQAQGDGEDPQTVGWCV
jgi:hypothetical protein